MHVTVTVKGTIPFPRNDTLLPAAPSPKDRLAWKEKSAGPGVSELSFLKLNKVKADESFAGFPPSLFNQQAGIQAVFPSSASCSSHNIRNGHLFVAEPPCMSAPIDHTFWVRPEGHGKTGGNTKDRRWTCNGCGMEGKTCRSKDQNEFHAMPPFQQKCIYAHVERAHVCSPNPAGHQSRHYYCHNTGEITCLIVYTCMRRIAN